MVEELEQETQQDPIPKLPKGYVAIKKSGLPPLPAGYVEKKNLSVNVSKEPSVGGLVVDGTTPKTRAGSIDFEASSLEAGNDLSKSNVEAGKEIPPAKNSLELVGEINDLSKVGTVHVSGGTGGAAAGFSQSPDAYKKSQENYTELKGRGLKDKDIAEIKNDLSDLSPEVQGLSVTDKDGKVSYPYSLKSLGELRDVDPIAYKTKLNAVKTYDVIRRTAGIEKANEFSRLQNQNQAQLNKYTDIEDFNRKKEKQKEIIRQTLKGDDRDIAMQRVDENSAIILNDAIPDSKSAEDYLNNRLYQSKGTLTKKLTLHDALTDNQDVEFTGNVNDFKLESIQSKLDPNNPADQIAFQKYKRGINLNNALNHSGSLDDAALNFAAAEDEHLAATIKTLNAGGQELPNSYKGEIVANFLNDPEVIAKAQDDPEFAKEYAKTAQNLYFNYPDFAKTEIGNIISQAREDGGYNNWFANVPTKGGTDKLVDKLVADGKMTELQKNIYLRDIAPELGVGKSILRGTGHILAPAFTDNSPIATPDLLTHAGEGWDNTMGGLYKSLKMATRIPTPTNLMPTTQSNGEVAMDLLDALKNEKENTVIQPKGLLHKASAASGDFIPLVVSMAVGGGMLKGAGKAGEAINMALQFAGNNAEKALVAFPDSPLKQKMYTGAATSIDMFLGRLLPHNKALSQEVSNSIRKDITGVISDFASEKITADAAKKTILNRIEDLVTKKAPEILKANTETGAIMAAFSAGHNGLDIAFGAKPPQSVEDFAKETAQAFETGFLGNTLVAAAMAGKNTATVKDNLLKASANPEHYIEQIKIAAAKNPEIAKQQEELINNVNVAVEARKVADAKGMNEKQTEDFILLHVAQNIQENTAKNATVDLVKEEATKQAKDLKARKEKVYGGEVDTKLSVPIDNVDEQGVPIGDNVPAPTDPKIEENRKLDLAEIDKKISEIDPNSATAEVQKANLEKQRAEINDYYDNYGKDKTIQPVEDKKVENDGVVVTPPINNGESIPLKTKEEIANENGIVVTPPLKTIEPIKLVNEETETTENIDKETGTSVNNEPPDKTGNTAAEGKEGKFEAKARKLADKIMATDIVPDWLKIDDPNVKKSGADAETIKKALADATITMGKLLDKGVEFGEAVKESVNDLVNMLGEGARSKIEEGFAKDYKNETNHELSGIKKALVSEKVIEGVDLERIGDKEMMALGRKILDTGEVKPEALVTKIITDGKGVLTPTEVVGLITYKRDIDNALQDTYKQLAERKANGEDIGTLGVEAKNLERQQNDFDVMAVITAQQQSMAFRLRQRMLDREYNVVTQIEKYKANNNGEIPADVEARFREIDKELKEVKAKLVEAEKAAADKEAQAAVDNIKESVGREKKYTEEELQAELKKERISARAEKKEKVHKAIDDMMDKWAKKVSPEHLRGTDTKGTNADKVFKSVGAIMKKAYDAGEVTAKIVEDAVNYISKKLGRKDWGIEEFRKENWDEKLKSGTEKKANDKPTINEDGTVKIPNQMLRDLVKRGITDIEGLTKEVHNQVKKDLPDVTERQVRDAITDYGKEVNKTADELQTQVNTAKRVGRLLSELEDIRTMGKIEFLAKYKKPKPSESKISERERELRTQIKALGKDIVGDVSKGTKESDSKHQTRIENLEKELLRIQERRKKEPQEKSASTREIPADEKALLDEIEAEQTKWNAEKDAARQAANDYGKMETERNRQLKRVADINEKIEILKSGKLPEPKSVEAKKDTPEIEALKSEKEALEKSVREGIAHEKKMKDLDAELQRLKDRKEKEPKPDSKRVISQEESLKRDEIEAERKAWDVEKNIEKLKTELQRVRDRQKKVTNPKDRRELTDTEKDLVKQIKAEQEVWNKEIEPARKVMEALKAAQKSLTEYERRIAEKDFSKNPESATPETPELKALREKRDAKRKEYEKLKKDTLPKIEKTEAERLKAAKESAQRRINELTTKIKNKDFAKPVKKLAVTDTELVKLNAEKERLQEEFDKEQYALDLKNRNVWQKWEDRAKEATNGLIRGLVASLDFSAPLVQGTMRLFTDLGKSGYQLATFKKLTPNRSINAIGTMFKHFFSEKASTAYMDKIKASEAYPLMKASKLAIGDNTNRISVKEGMFISNWIKAIWNHAIAPVLAVPISVGTKGDFRKAYNIAKVIDPYVASQRAFDGYLTSVRANTFSDIATYIGNKGYTFEADAKVFQKAADFVNTTTGRGSLGKAEQAASWLDIFLFAPRKVVSEFKLFTPYAFVYYAKMPKVVRKRAIKDLGSFLGTFVTANALLWAANKDEDDEDDSFWNPNSSNFLTHKFGDKRVSIGGGAKSMITFQSRFITGDFIDQYDKKTQLGERFGKEIDTRWDLFQNFVTGKAAPAWNIAIKKMKERRGVEMDDAEVLRNLTLPMWAQDLQDMYKEDPATVNAILTALSLFGANLRVVDKPKSQVVNDEFIKANPDLKVFIDKGISLPEYNPEKIQIKEVNGKVTEKLSDYPKETQDAYIKEHQANYKDELTKLKNGIYKVYKNKDGAVKIKTPSTDITGMTYTPFAKLTDEQVKYLEGKITSRATEKTKEKIKLKKP